MAAGTIGSMLSGLQESVNTWFKSGTYIIGYAIIFVGIISVIMAIWAIKKQQPSGKYWIVGLLAIILGGFILTGFGNMKQFAKSTGEESLDSAVKGQG